MKLKSPIPPKKARIEVIPLIDIMFFLLACFMLVSLSMIQMRGVKVALPAATHSTPENKSDFLAITVDALGGLYFEKESIAADQLTQRVRGAVTQNPEVRFYIRADRNVPHGEVITLLDRIRNCGVAKVSFEIKAQNIPPGGTSGGTSGSPVPPVPTATPVPSS